jgi:hypothetical protein
MKSINKIVLKNGEFMTGGKKVSENVVEAMCNRGELMVLGRCLQSNELLWEQAPAFELFDKFGVSVLYHVSDPIMRVDKRLQPVSENSLLPCSYYESQSPESDEKTNDLVEFKNELMNTELDVYFELADKSGEVMRSGTCRQNLMNKLLEWAESIGGSFYVEQLC